MTHQPETPTERQQIMTEMVEEKTEGRQSSDGSAPDRPSSAGDGDGDVKITPRPSTAKRVSFDSHVQPTIAPGKETPETPTSPPAESVELQQEEQPVLLVPVASPQQTDAVEDQEEERSVCTPTPTPHVDVVIDVDANEVTPLETVGLEDVGDINQEIIETETLLRNDEVTGEEAGEASHDDDREISVPVTAPDFKPDFSAFEVVSVDEDEHQGIAVGN